VKKKMTAEDFLKNNRGINDGQDLPADFMRSLYDRIVSNEIQVHLSHRPACRCLSCMRMVMTLAAAVMRCCLWCCACAWLAASAGT
jgi:hypothetical protein